MCAVSYFNTKTTIIFLFLYMYYNSCHIYEMDGLIYCYGFSPSIVDTRISP